MLPLFRLFFTPCFVLGCLFSTSCSSQIRTVSTNQSDYLSRDQIVNFINLAQHGDGNAAYRLYLYYACIELDYDAAIKWLARGATNGDDMSQYVLGMVYYGESYPERKDTVRAKYWLEKASANGNANAIFMLKQLK